MPFKNGQVLMAGDEIEMQPFLMPQVLFPSVLIVVKGISSTGSLRHCRRPPAAFKATSVKSHGD